MFVDVVDVLQVVVKLQLWSVPDYEAVVEISGICVYVFFVYGVVHGNFVPLEHVSVGDGTSSWVTHSYSMLLFVGVFLEIEVVVIEDKLGDLGENFRWYGGVVLSYESGYAFSCLVLWYGGVQCYYVKGY